MRRTLQVVGVAVVYTLLARIGLLLDPVGGFATVVWAPTGVGIAAVFLGGWWLGAGVLLGALAANLLTGAPVWTAVLIAIGNTLEALGAVAALRRISWFDPKLERVNDTLVFALVAAVAPIISASIGVAALSTAGIVGPPDVWRAWRAWWLGDAIGALVVGTLILGWAISGIRDLSSRLAEGVALLAALALVSVVVFSAATPSNGVSFVQAYLVFPLLIWSTVRFTLRGATTAVLLMCIVAVIGTARGTGPFIQTGLHESLFAVQSFMGIVSLSFLILASAVAERERANAVASKALLLAAEANRAKSDFLASISHELRTPLNAIAGYSQLLGMNIQGPLAPAQREALSRIETNQRHLAKLVDDVLSFTGVEAGQLTVRPKILQVVEAVQSLRPFVEPQATGRGVALRLSAIDRELFIFADPDRLRQILLNLVMNAIKYTDGGGTVDIAADATGDQVRVVISDSGIGIPEDLLPKVFEPFFQVDHGHTRRYPGVGLGLTISRDLARAMGGDIQLASQVNKGTVAIVVLPRVTPTAAAATTA